MLSKPSLTCLEGSLFPEGYFSLPKFIFLYKYLCNLWMCYLLIYLGSDEFCSVPFVFRSINGYTHLAFCVTALAF